MTGQERSCGEFRTFMEAEGAALVAARSQSRTRFFETSTTGPMTGQEARDDEREALTADPGAHGGPIPMYGMLDLWMALHGAERSEEFEPFYAEHGYAETWARLLHAVRLRKYPDPEITKPVGFYVIPKRDAPDQDSLWDGTIHPTHETAQASLDSAVAEWGHDAHNYSVVALVPFGEGEQ